VPVLLVRGGVRPSGLAPRESVTRYPAEISVVRTGVVTPFRGEYPLNVPIDLVGETFREKATRLEERIFGSVA
jgi:hypothetical protein